MSDDTCIIWADNTGWIVAHNVFGDLTFTLSLACSQVRSVIVKNKCIALRPSKNHIHSCVPDNQVKIYQTLCLLIEEHILTKFNELTDQFIQYWIDIESTFIEYFKQHYLTRPGQFSCHKPLLLLLCISRKMGKML